jgi:hypothetical protein
MGIKGLLVVVASSEASDSRVELAASLAAEHAAHLVGLYILPLLEPDPSRPDPLIDKIVAAYIREDHELARAARLRFDAASDRHGIKGEWRSAGGFASEEAAIHARYADLAIVGQINPSLKRTVIPPLIPDEVAFAAGTPILVTPFSWTPSRIGSRVLVAWNARREAARAVRDALPILRKAASVTVLVVNPEKWAISRMASSREPILPSTFHATASRCRSKLQIPRTPRCATLCARGLTRLARTFLSWELTAIPERSN